SPLAEPADCARTAPVQPVPASAAKNITNRARLGCVMRGAMNQLGVNGRRPGAFVLKRPSDREGRAPPAPRWAAGEFRRARLKRTERAGKKRELRTTRE